jgi:hypothetical protein
VDGNDAELQTLDLSAVGLTVQGRFRVGIQFAHSGSPSIASDGDGISAGLNFVDDSTLGWAAAEVLGVTGDWIIRATLP